MALTRKLLKGMNLTEEQIETIIEAHSETVVGLQTDLNKYKGDAELLPNVQKELDELKATGDGGYKEKYENEHKAFEDFKKAQTDKETRLAKENAYREFLKNVGVSEKRIPAIIKVTDLDGIEMDGDSFKDAEMLTESVKSEWADFIETIETDGAPTHNPPQNNPGTEIDLGTLSMEDYIKARKGE